MRVTGCLAGLALSLLTSFAGWAADPAFVFTDKEKTGTR